MEDSKVLKGVMINKDVVALRKMKRKIANPRIILLDCPLEYKQWEDQNKCRVGQRRRLGNSPENEGRIHWKSVHACNDRVFYATLAFLF